MRVLLAVVIALFLAAPASAHTITMAGAERVADRYAKRIATSARPVPRAWADDCRRRSHHGVDCVAVFRFRAVRCERTVRVRFPSPTRRWVSVRFADGPSCG